MSKQVYSKDSQEKLMEGINILADAVQSTLGPSGKTVMIKNLGEPPFTTKDGVTVAEVMDSNDPVINAGMQYIKMVASKMNVDFGDGTTTVTIMCRKMIQLGMELRKNDPNFDEHLFRTVIYECLEKAKHDVLRNSVKLELKDIHKIAFTSSNNDKEIADLFQAAYDHCGADGYINILESVTGKSYLSLIEGYVLQMGYIERSYANNHLTNFFEASRAKVFLYDGEFNDKKEALEIIRHLTIGTDIIPVLIIAKDFSKDVKGVFEFNNSDRIGVKACLVKNHLRNDEYSSLLQDLSEYTGAVPFKNYDRFDSQYGIVNDLIVKQGYTVFGKPNKTQAEILQNHIDNLLKASENEASAFHSEDMRKRVSKMQKGVTTLYVGGHSEVELIERKHRVEDAHKACSAALRGNVIVGGGQIWPLLYKNRPIHNYTDVFYNSIMEPFKMILRNSLHSDDHISKVWKNITFEKGYNAKTRNFENLMETGIIDPADIAIGSIENATSIAMTILNTECLIVETQNQ
jgi:chaperonin GroEL